MTALATMGTSGGSPPKALARLLYLFDGENRMTAIRVENPDAFLPLPRRFTLVRKAGVYWLTDSAAPPVIRGGTWTGGRR